jgi:hypothetical protein
MHRIGLRVTVAAFALLVGCRSSAPSAAGKLAAPDPVLLAAVDITDTLRPTGTPDKVVLSAARTEWISFAVQIRDVRGVLRINELQSATHQRIGSSNLSVYQVLPLPVQTNTAAYVRYTGLPVSDQPAPRALLAMGSAGGVVDLTRLRDPTHPFDPAGRAGTAGTTTLVWIDLHVPTAAAPGDYTATADLLPSGHGKPAARINLSLHVHDFAIPDARNLLMVSRIDWESLERLFPDRFEAITPRLLNRSEDVYAPAVRTLDQLMQLAEANRVEAVFGRLQPTVKWPAGEAPQADWSDFDSLISPWMSGSAFADKTPLGYWSLPAIDYLQNFDGQSQRDYWSLAATHFNQQDWLGRCPASIEKPPGRSGALRSVQVSMMAAQILRAHPLVRVMTPLEDEQLQFVSADNPDLLDPSSVDRIVSEARGLVFASPTQAWPSDLKRPAHWLATEVSGQAYIGAGGSERDVRVWAWLAFLQHAHLILWSNPLPEQDQPAQPADPDSLTWFYPGSWFGVDGPVPTIQLKWLRRAQQDYEYLRLASERGMSTEALMLARLMTKQVEIGPAQSPDPAYGLLSGTIDEETWDQARALLARSILLHAPRSGARPKAAAAAEQTALNLDMIRWQQPKERPFILPRVAKWFFGKPDNSNGDHWAALRLGVDIYNASDNRTDGSLLQWSSAGSGWEFNPRPVALDALQTYGVQRFWLQAGVDLDHIGPGSRLPLEITFVDGFTRNQYQAKTMLPVAASDRREGRLSIDGKLDDWYPSDLIEDGRLTRMLDRPSVQRRQMVAAATPTQLYTTWADDNFYLAFRVCGVTAPQPQRNFIDYQFGRAWGEDLCQALVQPINEDGSAGPITYLACKPGGVCVVQRRAQLSSGAEPWQQITGAAVRYAAQASSSAWTGEVAIPWKLILGADRARPPLLRFNFIQHLAATGESASWAGPIDNDMDDSFMGLIFVRDSDVPAAAGAGR